MKLLLGLTLLMTAAASPQNLVCGKDYTTATNMGGFEADTELSDIKQSGDSVTVNDIPDNGGLVVWASGGEITSNELTAVTGCQTHMYASSETKMLSITWTNSAGSDLYIGHSTGPHTAKVYFWKHTSTNSATKCDVYTCKIGTKKANAANIEGATDEVCCDAPATKCDVYTCKIGTKKANAANIEGATDEVCCDAPVVQQCNKTALSTDANVMMHCDAYFAAEAKNDTTLKNMHRCPCLSAVAPDRVLSVLSSCNIHDVNGQDEYDMCKPNYLEVCDPNPAANGDVARCSNKRKCNKKYMQCDKDTECQCWSIVGDLIVHIESDTLEGVATFTKDRRADNLTTGEFSGVAVQLKLRYKDKLTGSKSGLKMHIHDGSSTGIVGSNCSVSGGHFDPTSKEGATGYSCDKQTPLECYMGDLSGKYNARVQEGKVEYAETITVGTNAIFSFAKWHDATVNFDDIVGKALVFHDGSPKVACNDIEPQTVFTELNGPVKGKVELGSVKSFGVGVKAAWSYTDPAHAKTSGHAMHIHSGRNIDINNCTTAGGHFDPYGVEVTGYKCGADPSACYMGDLTGKANKTIMIPSDWSATDNTMEFAGPNSVVGRSIVLHEIQGSARIACANIRVHVFVEDNAPEQVNKPNPIDDDSSSAAAGGDDDDDDDSSSAAAGGDDDDDDDSSSAADGGDDDVDSSSAAGGGDEGSSGGSAIAPTNTPANTPTAADSEISVASAGSISTLLLAALASAVAIFA